LLLPSKFQTHQKKKKKKIFSYVLKLCMFLASQADKIPDGERAPAFGILAGVGSAAFVCGTLAARFLSTASTFKVLLRNC
jgi:hypothetical protein